MIQGIVELKNAETVFRIQMALAAKSMQIEREQGQAAIALLESAVESFEEASTGINTPLDLLA